MNYIQAKKNESDRKQVELLLLETIKSKVFITRYEFDGNLNPINPTVIDPLQLLERVVKASESTSQKLTVELLDSRVIAKTASTLVRCFTPSDSQRLHLSRESFKFKWNHFIFKLQGSKLSICVVESDQRPTLDTKVYHAPIPNIYSDGKICLGSCVLPNTDDINKLTETYLNSVKTTFHFNPFKEYSSQPPTDVYINKIVEPHADKQINCSDLKEIGTLKDFINA